MKKLVLLAIFALAAPALADDALTPTFARREIQRELGATVKITTPSNGQCLIYSSTDGAAEWGSAGAAGAATWANSLAAGSTTSGQTPVISIGDTLNIAGVASFSHGNNASGIMQFASTSADPMTREFFFENNIFSNSNNTQKNALWALAYNWRDCTAPQDTSESAIGWQIETNYSPTGSWDQMEMYWFFQLANGGTEYRPVQWSARRDTGYVNFSIEADSLTFADRSAANSWFNCIATSSTAAISLNTGTTITTNNNNQSWITQENAGGTFAPNLVYLNHDGYVVVGDSTSPGYPAEAAAGLCVGASEDCFIERGGTNSIQFGLNATASANGAAQTLAAPNGGSTSGFGGAITISGGNASTGSNNNGNGGVVLSPGAGAGNSTDKGIVFQLSQKGSSGSSAETVANVFGMFANSTASGGVFYGTSVAIVGWASSTTISGSTTPDTALSRDSAGVVDFGTGSQGSTAGSWKATTGTLVGGSVSSSTPYLTGSGQTQTATSGTVVLFGSFSGTAQDGGTTSTTVARGLYINPTINDTAASKTGSYEALTINSVETSLPTGTNFLFRCEAGASGGTDEFGVLNSGATGIGMAPNGNSFRTGGLNINATSYTNSDAIICNQLSNNSTGAVLLFMKSRGTTFGTSAAVQSGDQLGNFIGAGTYDTNPTHVLEGSGITFQVDGGTWTSSSAPGLILFATVATNSTTVSNRWVIDQAGFFKGTSGLVMGWCSSTDPTASLDTGLSRDSGGVIDFGTGAAASTAGSWKATTGTLSTNLVCPQVGTASAANLNLQYNSGTSMSLIGKPTTSSATTTVQTTGLNGGSVAYGVLHTSTTLSTGGATTNLGVNVPAGSVVYATSNRVTTGITTASTFNLEDSGGLFYGGTCAAAVTSTQVYGGPPATTSGGSTLAPNFYSSANTFKIVCNTTPGAGVVETIIYYYTVTAPTS